MKTYIALVRHGVTDWNYDGRAQGQTDIHLNDEGRRQAEAVAARLSTERWDVVYSSDLARAQSTAQALCRRTGHELILDSRLRERNIGLAEGTVESERQARWPGVPFNSLPGLENNQELGQRGLAVLTEIARKHPGQRVLVVSHGGLIATFLREITDGCMPYTISRNTGITPVLYDGQRFEVAGPHEYRHLLIDGVEYTGEKFRLVSEATRSGLPGLHLAPHEWEPFLSNATAVESAWVNGQLVGYVRAFTDRVRTGYVDLLYALPEYQRVEAELIERLERRFPGVRFEVLGSTVQEQSGA